MNYEANTIQWKKGDYVIHDCDAKTPDMLMRVINYTREGLCRTEYVNHTHMRQMRWGKGKRSRLINRIAVLHDPKRFNIPLPSETGTLPGEEELMAKFETIAIEATKQRFPMLLKLPTEREAEFNQIKALHKMDMGNVPDDLQEDTALLCAVREVAGDSVFKMIVEQAESLDVEFIEGFYGAIIARHQK